jgi:hypothetical protein
MYTTISRTFDQNNKHWTNRVRENTTFIQTTQNWMNDKLHVQGVVLLNDAYDALGLHRTRDGATMGWLNQRDKTINFDASPQPDGTINLYFQVEDVLDALPEF